MFVKWFQVLLFNISNSIYQVFPSNTNNLHIVVWFQITNNPHNPKEMIEQFSSSIDGTLINTTPPGQSGSKSNSNKGVIYWSIS